MTVRPGQYFDVWAPRGDPDGRHSLARAAAPTAP